MTSLQQIELALDIKVLRRCLEQIEAAFTAKEVELVHDFVVTMENKVHQIHDKLDSVLDSPEHLNGGERDTVEGTPPE